MDPQTGEVRGGAQREWLPRPWRPGDGPHPGRTFRPNARRLAIQLLEEFELKRQPVDRAIDQALESWNVPDRRDAGMVHEMVMGVLRHRRRLDMALAPLCTKPLEELSADLLAALRIGLYQLYYLERVPDHAAIKETVSALHPGPGRMANAVLREAQRRGAEILEVPGDSPMSPLERASIEWSMPDWLMLYLTENFGEDAAIQIADASHQKPQLVVRSNTPPLTRDEVMERLKREGFALAAPTPHSPLGVRLGMIGTHGPSNDWDFLRNGLACVQDEASQIVGMLMQAKPNERLLDFCAAPGGKTTLMASQMESRGLVVAVDRTIPKRRRIQQLAQKLGLTNVWVESTPPVEEAWPATGKLGGPPFDGILVDAPCSGLGTLARRPDVKWLKTREDLERLAQLQLAILKRVWPRLRPGGRLIYSTCTLGHVENQDVVRQFVAETRDASLSALSVEEFPFLAPEMITPDGFLQVLPHQWPMDGMFAARLIKG